MLVLRLEFDVLDFAEALLGIANEANVLATRLDHLHELDLLEGWHREWDDTFDADTVGDLANRHGLRRSLATNLEDETFEHLDTLFFGASGVHVFNLEVKTDGHARFHLVRRDRCRQRNSVRHKDMGGSLEEKSRSVNRIDI